MNCFPCCGPQKSKKSNSKREHGSTTPQETINAAKAPDMKKQRPDEQNQIAEPGNIQAQNFTFRELATATKNFRQECLLGEEGFGRVYKGIIPATGKAVAVKQFDRHGMENSKEFLAEVSTLSLLHHENLVNLIGYCADGDQRLLVFEFIHGFTLEDRLHENKTDQPPLNWFDRMKVAAGASKGLEYLHNSANPPVIYRDLKASNILLDNDLNAKLMDFGMSKISGGDKMNHAPPRVMGTYGYAAPEYVRTGQFTMKSDVYNFGIVLLELITGRRAIDTTRPNEEQNLVSWAQPLFRDPKRYPDMADPILNKHFPEKDLNQAVAIAAMCLQEEAEARPLISDVVTALGFLSTVPTEVIPPSLPPATSVSKKSSAGESEVESGSESASESEIASEAEDQEGEGYGHLAASAKYQGSDVSDIEDDHHHKKKNQDGANSQPQQVLSSKSSRKSSSRSRKGTLSSESGDGSVSSSNKSSSRKSHGALSQKTSRKSSVRDLSEKSSKKSSIKELSQKRSRKSSTRDLSHKSSGKSSARVLSHKSSMGSDDGSISSHGNGSLRSYSSSVASEDGGVMSGRSSSRLSQGSVSRRTEEESMRLDHVSSMGSDDGSGRPFDRTSSSGSDE